MLQLWYTTRYEVEGGLLVFLDGVPEDFRLVLHSTTCIYALDANLVPFVVVGLFQIDMSGENLHIVCEAVGEDGHHLCQTAVVGGVESHR